MERGDVIWLSFDPQAGHEQGGRRPALVISPGSYNDVSGLMIVCPITSKIKGRPFEVAIPPGLVVSGVVQSDHVKSMDARARNARPFGRLPSSVVNQVVGRIRTLI